MTKNQKLITINKPESTIICEEIKFNEKGKYFHKFEITCIECGDKFNEYSGSMEERTCTTCILKEEDPDAIKE